MPPTRSIMPPLAPLPGATLLSATTDLELDSEGTMESDELLGGGAPAAPSSPPPVPGAQAQQRTRWDRIVTAGLGVMGTSWVRVSLKTAGRFKRRRRWGRRTSNRTKSEE